MGRYKVKFYEGFYSTRQKNANKDKAICYVEQHLNASTDTNINYSLVIVGSNASQKSIDWARNYIKKLDDVYCPEWNYYGKDGVLKGGFNGRGDGNIKKTNMPALLLEPFFLTDIDIYAELVTKYEVLINTMADVLVESIVEQFPNGGLVAFSIGHKGKPRPFNWDKGACFTVKNNDLSKNPIFYEADVCEDILILAETKLIKK